MNDDPDDPGTAMTDWSYFVIARLPLDAQPPFPPSSRILLTGRHHRIWASEGMSQLDAMLLRWRVMSIHQCSMTTEVVHSPSDGPFQTGRI